MRKNKLQKGFSLIETIIYLAIFSLMVGAIISFSSIITNTRLHSQVVSEVNDQGSSVIKTITQALFNASSINSPAISTTATSLNIATIVPATNPTVFSLSGGVLYITEGAGIQVALTNNMVTVKNLVFYNLSRSGYPSVMQIRFTVSNAATSSNPASDYSNDFYATATLRK